VKEYIDDGITGTVLDRPVLEELRNDAKTDLFDRIYFHAADRIARGAAHQTIIISELNKCGKQITIAGKEYETTPEGKLTLNMLGIFLEYERCRKRQQLKANFLNSNSRSQRQVENFSRTPLGFTISAVENYLTFSM
jgi:DNA invertase Pin-like site-specific DNA recombinase